MRRFTAVVQLTFFICAAGAAGNGPDLLVTTGGRAAWISADRAVGADGRLRLTLPEYQLQALAKNARANREGSEPCKRFLGAAVESFAPTASMDDLLEHSSAFRRRGRAARRAELAARSARL